MFAVGFLFLVGAVVAVGAGQFAASRVAPVISIGLSVGAVVFTVVAMLMRPEE